MMAKIPVIFGKSILKSHDFLGINSFVFGVFARELIIAARGLRVYPDFRYSRGFEKPKC